MSHRTASGGPEPHLAEHELVDALEGTLESGRLAHASSCRACAAQVDELRAIAADLAPLDVPEPPAFFWSQLSARVRASIADERPWSLAWRRWAAPVVVIAAVAVMVSAIVSFSGFRLRNPGRAAPPAIALQSPDDDDAGEDVFGEMDNDETWALVRTLAEDLDHHDLEGEGVSARPGAADRLTLELSPSEQIELVRLLQEQLKGRTLPDPAS